jgi:uncharacterized protein (TIGR02453 family)
MFTTLPRNALLVNVPSVPSVLSGTRKLPPNGVAVRSGKMPVARKSVARPSAPPAAKTPLSPFRGFPKQGIRFLADLKQHQDREWFRERKETFEELVLHPMQRLAFEAAAACRKRGVPLYAREKAPTTRIYRDVRFSHNKDPFRTHIGAGLKRLGETGMGELFIYISPDSAFVGAGFWMPERPFIAAWRTAMAREPKKFLAVVASLAKHGLALSLEKPLQRLPRGYCQHEGTPIEEHLKLVSYTTHRKFKAAEVSSPKLIDVVAGFAAAAKPLLEYGWALGYQAKRDLLDERM